MNKYEQTLGGRLGHRDNPDGKFKLYTNYELTELCVSLHNQLDHAMELINQIADDDTPENIYQIAAQMYRAKIKLIEGDSHESE